MYFWKCWRDSSLYFFVFLISTVVCLSFLGTGARVPDAGIMAGLLLSLAAIGLGSVVASQEFSDGTIHFLFTKPRSRTYFVWVAWLTGLAELLAIAAVAIVQWWIAFVMHGGSGADAIRFFASARQADVAGRMVTSLLLYCLTFALTALLRNSGQGLGITLLVVMAIPSLRMLFRMRWHIDLPSPGGAIGSWPIAACYVVWTVVALAMIGTAQWYMEASEPK